MPTAWSSTTARSARCSTSSRSSASRTTPSSCTPPTTARRPSPGPTAARRCSAARRTRNWEGGYRVPTLIRWPGVIKPGTVINDIGAHEDMLTTLLAAAGDPNVKEELLKGKKIGDATTRCTRRLRPHARAQGRGRMAAQGVHLLDRRRQRRGAALRQLEDHFPEAERAKACSVWQEPFEELRAPLLDQSAHGSRSSGPSRKMPWATSAGSWSTCS